MRKLVTDLLEIAGLILIAAALGVLAWRVTPSLGLAVGGAALIGASVLLTVTAPKRVAR